MYRNLIYRKKKQEANESYNNEDKKLTVRLAIGAAIYAIGMALTVFAKVPLPIEFSFSHCLLYYSWRGCCMASCEEYFKGTCV